MLPFRWVEIEGWTGELHPEQIPRRAAYSSTWDDNAAAFESSDAMLNRIWELSRYSIKATTFAGVYVDGDRERLAPRYEALKNKLLLDRAGRDDLITSNWFKRRKGDIVDWPAWPGLSARKPMRNSLHRQNKTPTRHSRKNAFLPAAGVYRDGVGTDHVSLHANLFPLAFGLVPQADRTALASWLANRGMACSVHAAQYLLEGLFEYGAGASAVDLITASGDRSWRHMIESGLTITSEAWDMKYKANQDWNHAWGAAPANLLPRYVLGAQPYSPGWTVARIRPITSNLAYARGKVPTPRGPILIDWKNGRMEEWTTLYTFPHAAGKCLCHYRPPCVAGYEWRNRE